MTSGNPNVEIAEMTPAYAQHLAPQIAQSDPWQRLGISAQSIEILLTNPKSSMIRRALVLEGQAIGAMVIQSGWLAGLYLQHLSVLKEYRGLGVGEGAVDWLILRAREEKQRNVWLCVSAFNTHAIRFYTRHGFERAAELQDLLVNGEDEILMRHRLI